MKNLNYKIKRLFKQIRKFGLFIPLSNLLILYGSRFLPKSTTKKIANKKHAKVEAYLFKLLAPTLNEINQQDNPAMEYVENAPIWWCWLQGEENLPLIPRLCLQSVRKYANGHPVHIITLDNYKDYVTIPEDIARLHQEGKIKNAHFSDILRLSLLYKYGGLWSDATVFFSSTIPETIFDLSFYSIKTPEDGFYVSRCRWSSFFLAGWKYNPIFEMMIKMYDSYFNKDFHFVDYLMTDYFFNILYQKGPRIKKMIDDVPYNNTDTYLLKSLLYKKFDKDTWGKITKHTTLFKLDWRMYNDEELNLDKNNYYNQLKSLLEL